MSKPTPSATPFEKVTQPAAIQISRLRMVSVLNLGLSLTLVAYWYNLGQSWQLMGAAFVSAIATGLMLTGSNLPGRGQVRLGNNLFLAGLLFGWALQPVFFSDLLPLFILLNIVQVFFAVLVLYPGQRIGAWILTLLAVGLNLGSHYLITLDRLVLANLGQLFSITLVILVLQLGIILLRYIQRLQDRSIQLRLLFTSLFMVLAPIVLVGLSATWLSQNSSLDQIENQLIEIGRQKENQVNTWLAELKQHLNAEIARPELQERILQVISGYPGTYEGYQDVYDAQRQHFIQSIELYGVFDELLILDLRGNVLLTSYEEKHLRIYGNEMYFIRGMAGVHVSPPSYIIHFDKPMVMVSQPIQDEQGQVVGVLTGRAGLESLNSLMLDRTGLGEEGEAFLIGQGRTLWSVLLYSDPPTQRVNREAFGIVQALDGRKSGAAVYPNYWDIPVIGAYRWLPDLQAAMIVELPMAEVNQVAAQIGVSNAVLTILAAILAIFGASIVSRSIARPIAELDKTAQVIASGNLNLTANETRRDEIGRLGATFNQMTENLRSLISNLENRVDERTAELRERSNQIRTVAQVGSSLTSLRQLDVLLNEVSHLISERFGFYHVGIFLLDDEGEYAVLRASNSAGGRRMLERGHRLGVGQQGIVGYASGNRKPRIALDVGQDAVFFNNPDLPDTHSEMALPLIASGELLGVLDVQSTQSGAFTEDDVEVLQLLADQLAIAIQNARLFAQTEAALESARRAYGAISRDAWLERLETTPVLGFRSTERGLIDIGAQQHFSSTGQTGALRFPADKAAKQELSLPIIVRGNVIGYLETSKPRKTGTWSQDETNALNAIAEQLGVLLESARLYEETKIRAESERLIGEINTRIRQTLDLETVMRMAAEEVRKALDLAEVEIRLGEPEDVQQPANGNSQSHAVVTNGKHQPQPDQRSAA